jgi:hypothetical protein
MIKVKNEEDRFYKEGQAETGFPEAQTHSNVKLLKHILKFVYIFYFNSL